MGAKLRFLGAAKTVTGSMHMITSRGSSFIIDCGLFQGRRDESFERNSIFPFDPADVKACVLSHAHIDHSGNIPSLVKRGFTGKIVTTEATRDLCAEMLPDSGHIQEEDIKFVNKINQKRNLPPRKPLYTRKDAEDALRYIRGVGYRSPADVIEGVKVTFYDAGHVLGSAIPLLEISNGGAAPARLAYACDLGRKGIPILKDPETPPDIDYLILEGTYGGRLHDPIEEAEEAFAQTIRATTARGGKIVIPSFALERTQEILYFLSRLIRQSRIPRIPVYVDSPLAVSVTGVFKRHLECFDEEMRGRLESGDDPFGEKLITYVTEVADSKRLNVDPRSMIIISASGMCESGRILHHLANNIENPANTIIIVGFVAKNTLGRRIVEKQPVVKIFGEEHPLRAQVVIINAFSAHADQRELLEFAEPLKKRLKGVFLVHGDEDQLDSLDAILKERGFPVRVAAPEEEIELV